MPFRMLSYMQGSPEWLEWRKGKMSASIIASIMGIDPWTTPLMRYHMILNDAGVADNEHMARGRELEPIARDRINEINKSAYNPSCIERKDFSWMIASLDAWDQDQNIRLREIKCPGQKTHSIAKMGNVPDYYYPQLQWQMWVSGETSCFYDSFYESELESILVKRDNLFIEKMVDSAKEFYHRLLNFDPPDAVDKDYLIIDDYQATIDADNYRKICDQIESLEKLKESQRLKLIQVTGDRNAKIGPLTLTKVVRKGNIRYVDIPQIRELNLEPFRGKSIESWRIS